MNIKRLSIASTRKSGLCGLIGIGAVLLALSISIRHPLSYGTFNPLDRANLIRDYPEKLKVLQFVDIPGGGRRVLLRNLASTADSPFNYADFFDKNLLAFGRRVVSAEADSGGVTDVLISIGNGDGLGPVRIGGDGGEIVLHYITPDSNFARSVYQLDDDKIVPIGWTFDPSIDLVGLRFKKVQHIGLALAAAVVLFVLAWRSYKKEPKLPSGAAVGLAAAMAANHASGSVPAD